MKLTLEELQIIYEVFNQYMEDWIDIMEDSIFENKEFLKYNEIYKKLAKSLYLRKRRKNHERTNSR